ncbi:hydroxyethylthiazole kinase [Desulfocurvus sp.]|jgi:hydroxyethylthiazole kinase|uniref:hydroxyethylthiazole kinase n=1 Tax=Desulfocurvus sp. TaxID=2871698 RepID=UPI0025B7D725|nr:hydroxyethylthiazole kinase [Desulfocurvus sp.]MCK9239770.1 hydroxyethylthiazole kinase [Desulfocurvus sp.]
MPASNAIASVHSALERVRAERPLVHNITNFVVMNVTANALLALGASPVMAHAPEEVEELAALAGALVLNIGTLSGPWVGSMLLAGRAAAGRGVPVVLDPVGAGASRMRTRTTLDLLHEVRPAILRGNASEILAVAGALDAVDSARLEAIMAGAGATRGVDSAHSGRGVEEVARAVARAAGCVVVVSGAVDTVADARRTAFVSGGSELMTLVTGMGCTATALTGAFAAVVPDPFEAAVAGMAVMSAAGGAAAARSQGPGGMQAQFLDTLYTLDRADLEAQVRVEG